MSCLDWRKKEKVKRKRVGSIRYSFFKLPNAAFKVVFLHNVNIRSKGWITISIYGRPLVSPKTH